MLFCSVLLWALSLSCIKAVTSTAEDFSISNEDGAEISVLPIFGIPIALLPETLAELRPVSSSNEEVRHDTLPVMQPSLLPAEFTYYPNFEEEAFSKFISQLAQLINVTYEKHEQLIEHIKCVIPNPPLNCSRLLPYISKLDRQTLIPSWLNAESFIGIHSSHPIEYLTRVYMMLETQREEIKTQHRLMYEFVSCACKNQSNCTVCKDDKDNLFSESNDNYKSISPILPIQKPDSKFLPSFPIFKPSFSIFKPSSQDNSSSNVTSKPWNLFSIFQKPEKPILGNFWSIFNPFSGIFGQNHGQASNSSANDGSGLVFAITAGKLPLLPIGLYGVPIGSSASQQQHDKQQQQASSSQMNNSSDCENKTSSFQSSVTVSGTIHRDGDNQTVNSRVSNSGSSGNVINNNSSLKTILGIVGETNSAAGQTESGLKVSKDNKNHDVNFLNIIKESRNFVSNSGYKDFIGKPIIDLLKH